MCCVLLVGLADVELLYCCIVGSTVELESVQTLVDSLG